MPLVQPDVKGSPRRLSVQLEAEVLLRLRAYARMCGASLDHVVSQALCRLFEADAKEFGEYLQQNPNALDTRKLSKIAAGTPARRPRALAPPAAGEGKVPA